MATKRFQVALSFPGEKRDYVLQVAELLAEQLGKEAVFYDDWYKHQLARLDLMSYLQNIYHQQSQLIVPFLCADYERKEWCGLELMAIHDLIKKRQYQDIMPLRFDDANIPGFFSTGGYIDLRTHSPKETAELILLRLQDNSSIDFKYAGASNIKGDEFKATVYVEPVIITPAPIINGDWEVIDNYKVKDGLAVDTKTNLMWLRFAYGQTWQNQTWHTDTTEGEVVGIDAYDVAENCELIIREFNNKGGYGGYKDWRLPAINELRTLVETEKKWQGNDYINIKVFPYNNLSRWWSSTPNNSIVRYRFIDFYNGQEGRPDIAACVCGVRLVRSGQ